MRDNWKKEKLGDSVKLQGGYAFASNLFQDSGIPLIRISNISTNGIYKEFVYLPKEIARVNKEFLLNENDILIAMSGATTGKNCQITKDYLPALLNQRTGRFLIIDKEKIENSYLAFVINSPEFQKLLLVDAVGGAQPNISSKQIENLEVNLPPLPQQKKIAKILSTVDNVIEKTESAIAKYQAIKQGLMHDLFTRGIDVTTGKLRPKQQDAPELYKESALGLIPRDWEEGFISGVVEENSPVTYGIVQPGEYSQKGILLIRGKDYISGWAQESDFFKVKKELHNQFKRSTTVSGDILICIVGATYGAVGVVPEWIKEANITQTTARIRCNQKKFSPHFIEYYLKSSFGRLMIEKYVKGSAQPGLNLADVEKFITLYPKNINEQKLIGERIRTLDKKIQTEQQALSKYQQLKAGLLQDLLTGRVEVAID